MIAHFLDDYDFLAFPFRHNQVPPPPPPLRSPPPRPASVPVRRGELGIGRVIRVAVRVDDGHAVSIRLFGLWFDHTTWFVDPLVI